MRITSRATILSVVEVLVALAIGATLGVGVMWVLGADPVESLITMVTAFQAYENIVMSRMSILILTALAFAIPFKVGLFNIGAEGQLYIGAFIALVVGYTANTPILPLLAAALAGGLIGALAGVLRVYMNVNEVLSTIMLNWIAYWSILYLLVTRYTDPLFPHLSRSVKPEVMLGSINGIPVMLIVSIAVALAVYLFLNYTVPGLMMRVAGSNEPAARIRGARVERLRVMSMMLGGMLAGLGGGLLIIGHTGSIDTLMGTVSNYGYEGIGVALIGRNNPLGIVLSSFLYADLQAGSLRLQQTQEVPPELALMVNGIIIIVLSAPILYRIMMGVMKK